MRTASWKLPFRVLLWKGSPSASRYRARAVKAPVARAQAARPDRQADLHDWIAAGRTGPEFDRRWLDMKQDLIHEKTVSAARIRQRRSADLVRSSWEGD